MGNGTLNIPKDTLDGRPVRGARSMEILTHTIDCKREVRTRECQVLKTTNHAAIGSSIIIIQRITINSTEMIIGGHRSQGRSALEHSSPSKKINGIFPL